MSTKQKEANKNNAMKSTGPKTEEGKRTSCMNALKHGLTGAQVVIPGEDPEVFDAFKNQLFEEHSPESSLEEELVEQLATTLWRMKRIPVFEKAIFEWSRLETRQTDALLDFMFYQHKRGRELEEQLDKYQEETGENDFQIEIKEKIDESRDRYVSVLQEGRQPYAKIGRMLIKEGQGLEALNKLSRYDRELVRHMERLMDKLDAHQEKRMKTIESVD